MFVESAFITREFREEQIPILENVTCLSVVNIGNTTVIINGIPIVPTQIQVIVLADGTYSRVQLEQQYVQPPDPIIYGDVSIKQKGDKWYEAFIAQNKILLIYKKLI